MANEVKVLAMVDGVEREVEMRPMQLYVAWFKYEQDRRREVVKDAINAVIEDNDGCVRDSMIDELSASDAIDEICEQFDERMDCDDVQENVAKELVEDYIQWNDGFKDEDEDE